MLSLGISADAVRSVCHGAVNRPQTMRHFPRANAAPARKTIQRRKAEPRFAAMDHGNAKGRMTLSRWQ
jgi:hypothetical protein